jgi:hypothetical protein
MRLIKLIAPATLIATLALLAPHANAQTMGEYATTVGVASGDGTSMGTSIGGIGSGDLGGGSRTWGASSLGASFDERAGALSASGAGAGADFDSRAGSTGGSASESRWPTTSPLEGAGSDRFSDSSNRFQDQDRFSEQSERWASSDRFPTRSLNDNQNGLDTTANAINNY